MSWRDRMYADESAYDDGYGRSALGMRRPPAATLTLMIVHGAALVLMLMLHNGDGRTIPALLTLQADGVQPLGIVLHPIATVRAFSGIFVVLALWSLGGRMEPLLGQAKYVTLYVLANLAAGVVFFGLALLAPRLALAPLDYPVGALAALCFVGWRRFQQEPANVLGWTTTVGRVYAICGAVVAGLVVMRTGLGAVAWIAAAAAGVGVATWIASGGGIVWPARQRPRRVVRPSIPRTMPPRTSAPDDPDVDDILAKISRSGIESLTDDERRRLEAARRAKMRDS
jgi:membrane associated rhomboid family serine protease